MMHADIVAGYVQANAAARLRAVVAGRLVEAFKDVGLVAVGNALASVRYGDDHVAAFLTEQQRDAAASRCKFQGIREQVVYHLVDLLSVVIHHIAVGIVVEAEVDAPLFGIVAEGDEYTVQMVYDVTTLHVQRLATSIKSTEVKQGTHLLEQQLCVFADVLELSCQIVGCLSLLHLFNDLFQRRDDERQRCAQVVADIGEELKFHLRNLFHLLPFHQLSLSLGTLLLSFAHVAPL